MSNLFNFEEFTGNFAEQFPGTTAEYRNVLLGNAQAHAFFISFKKAKDLSAFWEDIRNFIAYKFQPTLTDEFSKWNLYLFFLAGPEIPLPLKYKIENDTFSSRKIVVGSDTVIEEIIQSHIINTPGISVNGQSAMLEEMFVQGELFKKAFEGMSTAKKKKVTLDSKGALDHITEALKNQSNEI